MFNLNKILDSYEGGYANVPGDKGGETYRGISRIFWPSWPGWIIIDQAKTSSLFPENLSKNAILQGKVEDFYNENFVKKYSLENFSDDIAAELFDEIINRGPKAVICNLQIVLNALNYASDGKPLFSDLKIDGVIGDKTVASARLVSSALIVKGLNALQGASYLQVAADNASQRKFIRGWLARI